MIGRRSRDLVLLKHADSPSRPLPGLGAKCTAEYVGLVICMQRYKFIRWACLWLVAFSASF